MTPVPERNRELLAMMHAQLGTLVEQGGQHTAHIENLQSDMGRVRSSLHEVRNNLQRIESSCPLMASGDVKKHPHQKNGNGGTVTWPMLRMMAVVSVTSGGIAAAVVLLIFQIVSGQ